MISFEEYCKLAENKNKSISHIAYRYCLNVQDSPEIRDMITDSDDAYRYCLNVQDRPEIRDMITDKSVFAYFFCKDIQNSLEMAKRILDGKYIKEYKNHFGYKPSEHPDLVVQRKMKLI